ncbi:hypothetical protein ACQKL6_18710 [Peribacillus sp. NPDC097197]|uniref:hypothetical protein n=1 Tax=Peribacillus sp. NPDC097197 TaxID=3390615 RepID=UPI003CFDAB4E
MRTIKIYDRDDLIEISFDDIKKYHGYAAYMALGVGFRVVEAAFEALYGDEIPNRKDLSVLSGHGGPGFRDVFEFVTRAKTRGVYTVDVNYPKAQYDPYRPTGYAYVFTKENGEAVEVLLKEDFLPPIFYDYLKKGREDDFSPEEYEDNERLKHELGNRAYEMPVEDLLIVTRLK